ncbi:hypothetical protein TRICI_004353 [Trichomonascus ciferrii]|uniref:SAM-dependent MTase RsmB/NOP-type domain-containing protein n=1 Tax=Trichomonascus ciferrii TaxID=44093 RepID=A0A642V0I9_9ASCO|nr:hypothetical protein TRICI_004353 [Trichomonascus ciferrii]
MLYTEAAQFLERGQTGSIKNIIYSKYENKKKNPGLKADPRQVVGLVTSVLKYKAFLKDVIKASGILKTEKKHLSEPVALLMVYDLLMSKSGRLNCGKCQQKDAILRHKVRLKGEFVKFKVKHKITSLETLAQGDETPVRWIRVNTIRSSDKHVREQLKHLTVVSDISEVKAGTLFVDPYVRHLYGVHPSEPITSTEIYKSGYIIIQDRASCFPAEILNPKDGDKIIDACAAPGNKTSHLAALIGNARGSVTAFERDTRRGEVLKKMIHTAGADKCVNINVQDFTESDPMQYSDVTGMVVDPSCSGSGIFGRGFEEQEEQSADKSRLDKLAEFQYKIMLHALSFPNVKRVVYSTCSIHDEENEQVVRRLLETDQVKKAGWNLTNALPKWPRRGHAGPFESKRSSETLAKYCVRSLPKTDGGIGFFAACFQKS